MYERMTVQDFNRKIADPLGLDPVGVEEHIEAAICQALAVIVDKMSTFPFLREVGDDELVMMHAHVHPADTWLRAAVADEIARRETP